MRKASPNPAERTWALGSVTRLTGLSPELLRAWERRHRAVQPHRTPGGARRYRASDLERLRLLKAAVEAGHRIGQLAGLSNAELEPLGRDAGDAPPRNHLGEVLAALADFDAAEAQRLLALQLSALGAVRFAHEIASPLAREIGERWADGSMGVASEHLATALLRSLLGSALQPGASALRGARILFATLSDERHELGLLMAALVAMGAGANPLYLGPDLPHEELARVTAQSGAAALALGLVNPPTAELTRSLAALREALPAHVALWIGGAGAMSLTPPAGVDHIASLEQLEQRVGLLALDAHRNG
jgi:DNA-binding transcriptional MerR regulator